MDDVPNELFNCWTNDRQTFLQIKMLHNMGQNRQLVKFSIFIKKKMGTKTGYFEPLRGIDCSPQLLIAAPETLWKLSDIVGFGRYLIHIHKTQNFEQSPTLLLLPDFSFSMLTLKTLLKYLGSQNSIFWAALQHQLFTTVINYHSKNSLKWYTGCPNKMYRICFANNFHSLHRTLSIHASNDSAILGDLLTLLVDGLASVWGSRERLRQLPRFGVKIQQQNLMPICTQT